MLTFLKKLRRMPYHVRKKVLNRVYNVLMYAILLITLFPIAWMIYTSFMSNNDILQGKIALQRVPYNILETKKSGDNVLLCTSDGALNIANFDKQKVLARKYFKTRHSKYAFDSKYIWLSSANKGLIKIDKNNIKKYRTKRINWSDGPLDYNKTSKTFIQVNEEQGRLWLSLGYKDYDTIFEYDMNSLEQTRKFNILASFPYSFEKIAISNVINVDNLLFVATNRGIAKIDLELGKVTKVYEKPEFSAAEVKNAISDPLTKKVYFASATKVYRYSLATDQLHEIYTTISGEGIEQITNMTLADDKIVLTTGHGLILITKQGRFVKEINDPLFDDVDKDGNLVNKGSYISSDVYNAEYVGAGLIYLGTSAGRATLYDLNTGTIKSTILANKKSYISIHWRNYIDLFHNVNFGLFLRNSFVICGITAIISMLLATITAYALVRYAFPGNRFVSTAILSTQMIPGVMTLIPIYIMFVTITKMTGIPIKGTFAGMIFVYSAFFLPFSIWILRGFFASIPIALEEAARIDGCSPLQVFYKIAVPLSLPGIVATGIFVFLVAWDELVFAWVLSNANTMTIPVGIRLFVGNFQNRYDLLMAASTVATIPVIIFFIMLQKQIVSGLTAGAVKQ